MVIVKCDTGICGFTAQIQAEELSRREVKLNFQCDCPNWKYMEEVEMVNPMKSCFKKKGECEFLAMMLEKCPHPMCPIPVATIKAVEVAAGLALKQDVHITFED